VITIAAICFPDISKVLSIIGGLCSVTLCFAIPTYAYVKLNRQPVRAWYNMGSLILAACLCSIGYASVVFTLCEGLFMAELGSH